ncbi:MAG: MATE family efflux transporter [Gammaproteobacteria bacterium]|nr:MATE family efflux transporter [Gammaproteobacteria bacterium]MBT8093279.1 MATE family efflux transporter [Gammaproteobacteria bacterium]MBT8106085.1 MATE family efflux transporter [Gammaproteobacteria bacterium]NNK26099.1 MATE family efflux transporter [Woeseiaceae bacterium]NNL62194.1 MATE family efflux transporter [Woeseiaceae bacterium]
MNSRPAMLTEGPVGRHIFNMAWPMLVGITMIMAQAFIDTWFLGLVGDDALAAYSFGFPIIMIVMSVAIGLGAGTSSVVARAIGAHDHERAKRLVTDSHILSLLIAVVCVVVGVLTIDALFLALGAPPEMIPEIRVFMTIMYGAVPFMILGMVATSSMRATGDTVLPSKLMIAAAILNVILDPIFIFGFGPIPALGLNGAAIAGLVSRALFFFVSLYYLSHRLDLVTYAKPDPAEMRSSWGDVLHVGLPAAGTNVIVPMGLALVTAMVASYGPNAVAGFGVASRIEAMVLVPYYALSAIIGPFVGQNLATGKDDRIRESLNLCAKFCIASGLVIAAVLALGSGFLPSLFSENPEVTDVARTFLWVAPLGYGAYGIVMVVNAAFNGLGNPMPGVAISTLRVLAIYIPLAFLGKALFGIVGIFAAYCLANLVSGVVGYLWARSAAHRLAISKVHADTA